MTVLPFRTAEDWAAAIEPVRRHCEASGLIAYPTETVYGLGSRARSNDVAALAALKGRHADQPFLLLVGSRAMAEGLGLTFPVAAQALADHFWPGPLTLVLPISDGDVPNTLQGPEGGIAVRWTSHKGMEMLVNGLGMPITSTSANHRDDSPAPSVEALSLTFRDAIDAGTLLVLDGGVLETVRPSTIVDCTDDRPRVIRPGAISVTDLHEAAGSVAS